MSRTPPRLLMALALVGATALAQLSVLVTMVGLPAGIVSSPTVGPLLRIQLATRPLDLGLLLLAPLAVLLSRPVEPSAPAPSHPATRTVLLGAVAVGAASAFLLALRLVADLGGDARLMNLTVPGTLVYDLGLLLVAGAGAVWAYRELQGTPSTPTQPGSTPAPQPDEPPPPPTGFPSGPPLAPPPPPDQPHLQG